MDLREARWRKVWLGWPWLLAGLAGLAAFGVLRVWVPLEGRQNAVCLFRRLTGVPCPGCGLTRAFAHLAKGEWSAALADHPFSPLIALEIVLFWAAWGGALLGRLPAHPRDWVGRVAVCQTALLCALWLGRLATGTLPW